MSIEVAKQCCLKLEATKITDRKNGRDQLMNLLNNDSLVAILNEKSEREASFDWSQIFHASIAYFIKEAQRLEEAERKNEEASATTISNRNVMKRQAGALPVYVLKKASKNKPHVKVKLVVELVLRILSRDRSYLLENFCNDAFQIIDKFILRFPEYYLYLSIEKWRDLVGMCIWVYEHDVPKKDSKYIIRVLEGIVRSCKFINGSTHRMSPFIIAFKRIPGFLTSALNSPDLSKDHPLQTCLLGLLLEFCSVTGSEWRSLLCSLGEETWQPVLHMWEDIDPPSPRQTKLLQYFNLQLLMHDPQTEGVNPSGSSLSQDSVAWRRCKHRLYQVVHDHLDELSQRHKMSYHGKSSAGRALLYLSQPLLDLAARLCHQIFQETEGYGVLEITQAGQTQVPTQQDRGRGPSSHAKRRRVEVGWDPLITWLKEEGTATHMGPWYQILHEMLIRFPKFFDGIKCVQTLDLFTHLLVVCKKPQIQEQILRCLNSLAKPYSCLIEQNKGENKETLTKKSWASIADLTLRLVSGKQCSSAGLELLTTLLKTDLISPDDALYRMFYKGHVESNTNALQTLGLVLNKVPLPKQFKSGSNLRTGEIAQVSLFNALLPLQSDEDAIIGNGTTQLAVLDDPRLLGTILVSLCYRTPRYSKEAIWRRLQGEPATPVSKDTVGDVDDLKELEELYLISSFSMDSLSQRQRHTNNMEVVKEAKMVPEFKEKLIIHLTAVIHQFLNSSPDEVSSLSDYVGRLISLAELITTILHHIKDHRLVNEQKNIIQKMLVGIIKILEEPESTRWNTLLPHLNSITQFLLTEKNEYMNSSSENVHHVVVQSVFTSPMQSQIFNTLFQHIKLRTSPTANPSQLMLSQSQGGQSNSSFARGNSNMDFDPDFDDPDESSVGRMDDFDSMNENLTRESSTSDAHEQQQVEDVNGLSVRDQCIVASLRWLVYGTSGVELQKQEDEGLFSPLLEAVDAITEYTKQPRLDYADITMVLAFIEALFVDEYNEMKIEEGCGILQHICIKHSSDSQVAAYILILLRDLIKNHGGVLSDDLKNNVVAFVRGLATKLYKNREYGTKVDKAIYNIDVELTKLDPNRSWSLYKVEGTENAGFLYGPLGASQHKLRIMAARNIHLLLQHENGKPLRGDQQNEIFEKVYQAALEALTVQGEVPNTIIGDEGSNVVASFLLSLATITQSSRFLEKKALFALFIAIPQRGIQEKLVARVITKIAKSKGSPLEDYMNKHLPYILQQWLKHNLNLPDFPVNLLQCSNLEEFVGKNLKVLTAVCLEHDTRNGSASALPSISILSETCQKSPTDLYLANLPLLISHNFPYLTAESKSHHGIDIKKVKSAKIRQNLLQNTIGVDVMSEHIEKYLGLVALYLSGLCHNPNSMDVEEVVVEPNPPHFTPALIQDTFNFFGIFFGEDTPFIEILCKRKAIHELLQGLLQRMHDCNCETSARLALDSIAIIVESIVLYLPKELQQICHYPLRSLTHILTFYTEKLINFAPHLADKCNSLLYKLWNTALNTVTKIASRNLPLLISRMIPQCSADSATKDSALKILALIMKNQDSDIQETVASLPYFPNKDGYEALTEIREFHLQIVAACRNEPCLSDEVELFLSDSTDFTHPYALKHLKAILKKYQNQINILFKKTDLENTSLGHVLMHKLVKISSKTNSAVAIEACKCLGELGPVHLGTQVFHVLDDRLSENEQVGKIITILHGYLVSEKYSVVEASAMVLQQMLATKEGFQAVQNLKKPIQDDLRPLRSNAKSKTTTASSRSGVGNEEYKQIVSNEYVWYETHSYDEWICGLVNLLIEAGCSSDAIACTMPICKIQPAFSAMVLPIVVHSALTNDTVDRRDILSQQIAKFFSLHDANQDVGNTENITQNKAALQDLLNVIDYLRWQTPEHSFTQGSNRNISPWECNLWLEIDYLQVAKAAQFCGAHFSSLLYIELYCESLREKLYEDENNKRQMQDQLSLLQQISQLPESNVLRSLLLQVYNSLGDSDGVEGCGLFDVGVGGILNCTTRGIRCKHRGQWLQNLAINDAAHETHGVVAGLQHLGLFSTVDTLISSVNQKISPELQEAQLECAWRLGKWDLEIESNQKDLSNLPFEGGGVSLSVRASNISSFHKHLFCALQCLHFQDLTNFPLHIQLGYQAVAHELQQNTAECSNSIYPLLSQLQVLLETEAVASCLTQDPTSQMLDLNLETLENVWASHDRVLKVCYNQEPILAGRVSVLAALKTKNRDSTSLSALLHERLISKVRIWRENTKSSSTFVNSAAEEASLRAAASLPLDIEQLWITQLEAAHVAQCRRDLQQASQSLSLLLQDINRVPSLSISQQQILCQVLNLYGNVLMDTRSRPPDTIIKDYYLKAIKILEEKDDLESKNILETSYHELGSYADKLYSEVHLHLESDTVISKQVNIKKSEEELHRIKKLHEKAADEKEKKDISRKYTTLDKNSKIDRNYIEDLESQKTAYLHQSLKHYTRCVQMSTSHDLRMFRIVALWFKNLKDAKTNQIIIDFSNDIQTYKYVALIYQLVARLSKNGESHNHHRDFPKILFFILERVCVDHPHHCLPVVMALANAHADDDFGAQNNSNSRKKSQASAVLEEERVRKAKELVEKLKNHLPEHVEEMQKICAAYLQLANWGAKETVNMAAGSKIKLPSNLIICNLKNLEYCASLTQSLPIQHSTEYSPSLITSWESQFTFVGGINIPKRLTQHRSDGTKSYELLKGKDDIRQDAVMEQVFGIVNKLLLQNRETREKCLSIRTYQAVPLSQRSGLIQWCDNTQPFGKYVIGDDKKSGAHKTYYPNDLNATQCRKKMHEAAAKSGTLDKKLQGFMAILERFHPVFRHFFFENFKSPHEWYQKRLAYTRSVATNSMVGYILGLGDRHVENILLDQTTAELIHIDLGIAFEMGQILPTPETIPFRLTQDIVDGLGVLGVEGPLRASCESTLGVLRKSGEVLVTIVEVLKHDPLHSWTLSPQQIARLQKSDDDDEQQIEFAGGVSMADRVVLRVQQKLAGVENGYARTVQEQVTVLLQQAMDLSNLCRVFSGWQPYV